MKFIYRPFGLIAGLIAGRVAMKLFRRLWRTVADEEEAPKAKDRDRTWREVVLAATVQGAVFGGTKAIIDRAGATGYERMTGVWPGREKTK
jgi:hypothetical protein